MNWYYERWMEALDKPSPYWHGLPPVAWFTSAPWPWEVPVSNALIKEGPKSLVLWRQK